MALLDLLGRRWALRVLWELRYDPLPFRALQEHGGGISPTALSRRLVELREAGLVVLQEGGGYALTSEGRELCKRLGPLDAWARRWAARRQS
jgi:DNA-binding HxlR family transcriptional regulator